MSGIEFAQYGRLVLVLGFVIGLLILCAWVVQRFGLLGFAKSEKTQDALLCLVANLPLDPRRRLLAVTFGGRSYLVLLGPAGEQILEVPNAPPPQPLPGVSLPQEPSFEPRRGL